MANASYLPWPDNGEVVEDELIDKTLQSIVKGIHFAFDLTRKNEGKDIPYEGLNHGRFSHGDLSPTNQLTTENLAWLKENGEDGQDALFELIRIAYKVGIEQGRRFQFQEMLKRLNGTKELCEHSLKLLRDYY